VFQERDVAGEHSVVDVFDVESLVEKRLDAVKHLSGSYGSGWRGGCGYGERCERLESDRHDGDISFSGCGIVGSIFGEEVENLGVRLHRN
jgi:hypothetical protein